MSDGAAWYLGLPLGASLLFAVGLMLIKKAGQAGVTTSAVTVITNLLTAALFAGLWLMSDERGAPWERIWQPVVVAILFLAGQICTFWAVERGDVSVATPILSVKVFLVAVFLALIAEQPVSGRVWLAASAAAVGVALIQRRDAKSRRGGLVTSVVFALAAAAFFALFDVLVQSWAPAWGTGRLLPIVFGLSAALSLGLLPWTDLRSLTPHGRKLLLAGSLLIALQSLLVVVTIAHFGDAARVNVMYALRGIWGVALAWLFARWLGGGELHLSRRTLASRLVGASLVTVAVIVAIRSKVG